jgi:hypothetical protein
MVTLKMVPVDITLRIEKVNLKKMFLMIMIVRNKESTSTKNKIKNSIHKQEE